MITHKSYNALGMSAAGSEVRTDAVCIPDKVKKVAVQSLALVRCAVLILWKITQKFSILSVIICCLFIDVSRV